MIQFTGHKICLRKVYGTAIFSIVTESGSHQQDLILKCFHCSEKKPHTSQQSLLFLLPAPIQSRLQQLLMYLLSL